MPTRQQRLIFKGVNVIDFDPYPKTHEVVVLKTFLAIVAFALVVFVINVLLEWL